MLTEVQGLNYKEMKKNIKLLFHLSWVSSFYFILVALETYGVIKIDAIIFGVIRELITLPLIAIQLVLFIWTLIYLIKNPSDRKGYMLWTFLISMVNSAIFIYGFF